MNDLPASALVESRIRDEQSRLLSRLRRSLRAAEDRRLEYLRVIHRQQQAVAELLQRNHELAAVRRTRWWRVGEALGRAPMPPVPPQPHVPPHGERMPAERTAVATLIENRSRLRQLLRSRWRRIGQGLGLAKRMDWEAPFLARWDHPVAIEDQDHTHVVIDRADLALLCDDDRNLRITLNSRWRRIGQMIGMAQRLDWEDEVAGWQPPAVPTLSDAEMEQAATLAQAAVIEDYFAQAEDTCRRFVFECRSYGVDVVLDIGANHGQFVKELRHTGYVGEVVSFEPLSHAYVHLEAAAAKDPLWTLAPRCAVGAEPGEAQINIAANSYSSSLLDMLPDHMEAAPESVYTATESCQVVTVADHLRTHYPDPSLRFAMKIDAQGYERFVIAGAVGELERVSVILTEMSLAPLYEGTATVDELIALLRRHGFMLIALAPEFANPENRELLQVNGLFVRKPQA